MKDFTVTIDLGDVVKHGGIEAAVIAAVDGDSEVLLATPQAMGGQTFATSGPGPGWTKRFDATDYARAAIAEDIANSGCEPGESWAFDPADGRVATGVADDDGVMSGIEWGDESVVRVECPDIGEAADHPAVVAEMAAAVIATHGDRSDRKAWAALVESARQLTDALDGIDVDDLTD